MRPREGRAARAVGVGVAVGADLARVLDGQRRSAPGHEIDAQRAFGRAQRTRRRRAFERTAPRLDEGLLTAGIEGQITLGCMGWRNSKPDCSAERGKSAGDAHRETSEKTLQDMIMHIRTILIFLKEKCLS